MCRDVRRSTRHIDRRGISGEPDAVAVSVLQTSCVSGVHASRKNRSSAASAMHRSPDPVHGRLERSDQSSDHESAVPGGAMICTCGGQTEVLNTTPGELTAIRRRRCVQCATVVMTVEMTAHDAMAIAESCANADRPGLRISDADLRRMARLPWARVTRSTIRPRRRT